MKQYQSHKIVSAARIISVAQKPRPHKGNPMGERELTLDDGNLILASEAQFDKAEVGGYYVLYDGGQYASYSPAKAFEDGYTEIKPAAPAGPGNAPKVTLEDIHAAIASEHYFTAFDGVRGSADGETELLPLASPLHQMTFCVLVLRNGFTLVGKSACVSVENFDADLGRKYAHEDAINQAWPLMGFALADRLHRAKLAPQDKRKLQIQAMYFLESTMQSDGSLLKNKDDVLNLIWGAHQIIQAMEPNGFRADNFDSICSDAMASANRAGDAPASTLPPHQQRVVDENIELNDRLLKLQAFIGTKGKNDSIFDKLDVDEQSRLYKQHDFMLNYSAILIARIAAFK